MPTPHISREEAKRRIEAVNVCLRRGFRPPGYPGKGPAALTQAAADLGLGRNATTMRVFEVIKAVYGTQPNWGLYNPASVARPVSQAVPQQVVVPEPLNVPPPPPPTLLERLKKGPVSDGYDDEDVHLLRRQGHNVHERAGVLTLEKDVQPAFIGGPVFEYVSRPDNTFHFGATSDNHLCFPANTRVETIKGPKRISSIKPGDLVLTHKNRYRRVSKVVASKGDGVFSRINFRGQSRGGTDAYASLVCTPNHPVLVARGDATGFVPAGEIVPGDAVKYLSRPCKMPGCRTRVPVGFSVCKDHDPFVRPLSDSGKRQRYETQSKASISQHFVNDIAPTMASWAAEGWRVIPVDKVRPDFIAVKDGEIVAVEIEAPSNKIRPRPMKEKYEWAGYDKYYDRVEWIEVDRRSKKTNRTYDWHLEDEHSFVGMVVSSVERFRTRPTKVYNLVVEEDETYVAKRCVVHNCSKYERLDVLNSLYDTFAKEGVDRVFNAGNWVDGEARFNKFDLHTHGMDNQLAYLAAEYPQRKGLVTYAVAGDDHEGWYGQREGVDIGKYAEHVMRQAGREDWVNLGYMEAHVKLVNANTGAFSMLAVVHPGGGSAYALSYSIQKIIESLDGGEKPAVGLYGHYHKLWAGNIRNVWCLQTGCFTANTRIETTAGRVSIKNIKLGDEVVTHLGRPRKVTRLYERLHYGDMVSLNYGRVGRFDQTLTATPEHPVLTETAEGRKEWKEISEIRVGDVVFVKSRPCSVTGEPIPYWMKMSRNANPMDLSEARDKLSATKGKKVWTRGGSDGDVHLQRDILPFCATMEAEGWRMLPVGASQIPDAIGIKDGKVVAFEVERSRGRLLEHKKAKYEGSALGAKVDEVRWVPLTERLIQPRSWYEYDEETTMCKVAVVGVKRSKPTRPTRVYNFEVEDDNSYIAGNVAVHNCTEDQTPFMRKKKLEAHVGGALVKLTQDPETGAIVRFQPEMMRFFNRGFYNHRWSHGSMPVMPHRSV